MGIWAGWLGYHHISLALPGLLIISAARVKPNDGSFRNLEYE